MAFVSIRSSNPKFSYIIRKNPASGLNIKELRKGKVFSWFSEKIKETEENIGGETDGESLCDVEKKVQHEEKSHSKDREDDKNGISTTYNIYFRDSPSEVSFPKTYDEVFEYINVSRYNSPLFVTSITKELFNSLYKEDSLDDAEDEYEHEVYVNLLEVKKDHYFSFFLKNIPGYEIQYKEKGSRNYQVIFKTKKSLRKLIHYVDLFCMFAAIQEYQTVSIPDEVVNKYLVSLELLNVRYFIKYLFKLHFMNSPKIFQKYKQRLECILADGEDKIEYTFLSARNSRKEKIQELVDVGNDILDIGCGNGYIAEILTKKQYKHAESLGIETKQYYAVDIDENALEEVKNKAKVKKLDNITTFKSLTEFAEFIKTRHEAETDKINEEARETGEYIENRENKEVGESGLKRQKLDIILSEVIEHLEEKDAETILEQIKQNPQGYKIDKFILTTPNKEFNQFYQFTEEEKRNDGHVKEYTKIEIKNLLERVFGKNYKIEILDVGDIVNGIPTTIGAVVKAKTT